MKPTLFPISMKLPMAAGNNVEQASRLPGEHVGPSFTVGFADGGRPDACPTLRFMGRASVRQKSSSTELPTISKPLLRWFTWYSRRYVRRHFNTLRVTGTELSQVQLDRPLVVYSNHASWWDPLVALLFGAEFLPGKRVFAPMDAVALERYGFFKRLGAFGVEQGTRRGGGQFLRTARAILQESGNALWLTPQGRFADARERPLTFKAGIGHLPGRARAIEFVPVAIEFVFWEERLPEILVRVGEPYRATLGDRAVNPEWWTAFFADRLRETQGELVKQAQRRDPSEFRCLLRGRAGVGGVYDRWRRFKAGWRGDQFQAEHGKL